MSFREKSAWISLLSMSAIYGSYFWSAVHSGPHFGDIHLLSLLATIILLVIIQVALTIAVAIFAPKDAQVPRDERDRLIGLRATHFAYAALATSVALACLFGAFHPPIIFNANALLFLLVLAEILRSGCQIVQYRRGA
jgi:quinol-cytochrome oxidoreductase complex cytochrome b subunit